jgi:hypothetical protein
MIALRNNLILLTAEKLRSVDAETTGTVNANLKSASRSGNPQLMADSWAYTSRVVLGLVCGTYF